MKKERDGMKQNTRNIEGPAISHKEKKTRCLNVYKTRIAKAQTYKYVEKV